MKEVIPIRSSLRLNDIKNLVKTGEGTFLEFKRTIPSAEKIAREMCAFANSKGGKLLIGVDDDGTLVGVSDYYEQHFLLEEAANILCSPVLTYKVEIIPFKKKDIVMASVPESKVKPIKVGIEGKKQGYIRVNDKSMRASREMLLVLRNQTSNEGVTFDYGPNEQKLFRYLNEFERITVKEFSSLVNISKRRASRILVNLVSAGVLLLLTHEKADYFSLARPV